MNGTQQAPPVPNSAATQRVLVVEDLEDTRVSLQELLQMTLNLHVDTAENGATALALLRDRPYSLVITDLRMPKVGGMELIATIQAEKIPVTVIVTTGHGSVKDAVEAMRMGAYDFLTKPADPQHLCLLVQGALRQRSLQDEVAALRQELGDRHKFQNVLSRSPAMHAVFELVTNIADRNATVLIRGETGTGKEQVARAIHQASASYQPGSFVAVNCGALNENLLESELFGHEKGAFTGADRKRIGRFELAHRGTLFLDEIGDVPMSMQIKLLRVLQERKFERVGGADPIEVNVRVVAATHQDMEKLVKERKFREDLYYRLNVIRIDLPPLRNRTEDIPVLVGHFCKKFGRASQGPPSVSREAMAVLTQCPWPGNVRQLENAIERACITCRDGVIRVKDLPLDVHPRPAGRRRLLQVDLSRSLPDQTTELIAAFEKLYLRRALRKTRGHVGKCARLAGLSRRSISDKISQYAIDKNEFKANE